ncbi:MAG: NADH-quinone oxidoreductase subunit L [Chloroflexi bacterium]|nr:NADH-quinone oxidoreductase subunit L [Chloroflexota bacterium]
MPSTLWLILLLPVVSLALITLLRPAPRWSGRLTILAIGGSFVFSVVAFFEMLTRQQAAVAAHQEVEPVVSMVPWFQLGKTSFEVGVLADPLAAIMLLVVTTVSLLVQVYSQGYMAGDPGYRRYFAFMSLFTFSMLGLVLAPNFLQMFIFWELVGVSSYLLIGFWYHKPEAAYAAKKAFITTRLGDLGFLVGILMLYAYTGTFDFHQLQAAVKVGALGGAVLSTAMVLVFMGAVGKSAQFPLHVWLPDAMEGPTPVSALIHAATMVAAGVYLVARAFPLFQAAPTALMVVAVVGGFTAFFAATMGLVMSDIKRVLAYSTVSQLGYMMLGLGVGALSAGMFHLFTHAFFKALLFLAAGSVIHGAMEQDLFKLGGLRRHMPWTALTFAIGGLSLAGVPPLAGFWSKDEVLTAVYHSGNGLLLALGLLTAFMTAFYITRAWLLAFAGEWRGAAAAPPLPPGYALTPRPSPTGYALTPGPTPTGRGVGGEGVPAAGSEAGHGGSHGGSPGAHAHESPAVMVVPLLILAVPSVVAGFLGLPGANWFGSFLHGEEESAAEGIVIASSVVLAGLGILLGYLTYGARAISAEGLTAAFRPIHALLVNKYGLDDLYGWLVNRLYVGISLALAWFDQRIVDGLVNLVAWLAAQVGRGVTRTATGQLPNYALAVFAGVVVIANVVAVVAGR